MSLASVCFGAVVLRDDTNPHKSPLSSSSASSSNTNHISTNQTTSTSSSSSVSTSLSVGGNEDTTTPSLNTPLSPQQQRQQPHPSDSNNNKSNLNVDPGRSKRSAVYRPAYGSNPVEDEFVDYYNLLTSSDQKSSSSYSSSKSSRQQHLQQHRQPSIQQQTLHNSRRQHHTPHSHRSHNQQSLAVASMPVASASISSASSFDMPPPPQSPSLKEPLEVGQAAAAAAAGGSAAAAAELAPAALAFKSAGRSLARNIMKRRPRYGRYDVPQIECPRSPDRMEKFACPTPDFRQRYRCIDDTALCDGFFDCPGQEDENPDQCLFYKTTKAHLDILAEALLRWVRGR